MLRALLSHRAAQGRAVIWTLGLVLLLLVAAGLAAWQAGVRLTMSGTLANSSENAKGGVADPHDHAGHAGHDDAGHEGAGSDFVKISEQAARNIGLLLAKIELQPFERSVSIPAVVMERPGRSAVQVTAPFTGIVTRVLPVQGSAVEPGSELFELRLTHEDLVKAQGEFLQTAEELDVVAKEIERLERVTSGAVAGKTVLERKYEQQRQAAVLHAQRQALVLHGLSEQQIDEIVDSRTLLQKLTVTAPASGAGEQTEGGNDKAVPLQVQEITVAQGQHVEAGETLAVLTNHQTLYLEGEAFEKDIPLIDAALAKSWKVSATLEAEGGQSQVKDLELIYLAGRVDPETRGFHFYVELPNELLRDARESGDARFIDWRFKPGQRMQLHVPIERWESRMVLPSEAIAEEGIETYVFQPNGNGFERRRVHVEYRDRRSAVISQDGSIYPGDMLVMAGAQQLQLALKAKSGGEVGHHHGHEH